MVRRWWNVGVWAIAFGLGAMAMGEGSGERAVSPPAGAASQPGRVVNVLYVDTAPRWEFRYLRNELIRDKSVNISTLLLSADPGFEQAADPKVVDASGKVVFPGALEKFPETAEELGKFDVLLIGDVSSKDFSPAQQKLIVEFVEKAGHGIGWIAGPNHVPQSYASTELEGLIPASSGKHEEAPANEGFTVKLTEAGKKCRLFAFEGAENRNVEEFAPMYWYKPVTAKADTQVLAVHATRMAGGKPAPLIGMGTRGKGRVMFSAVGDTWRWRRDGGEKAFCSYWVEMCHLLGGSKDLEESSTK